MSIMSTRATLTGTRQCGIYLSLADYMLIQRAAAAKRTNMSTLMLELMAPGLKRLRKNPQVRDDDDE